MGPWLECVVGVRVVPLAGALSWRASRNRAGTFSGGDSGVETQRLARRYWWGSVVCVCAAKVRPRRSMAAAKLQVA